MSSRIHKTLNIHIARLSTHGLNWKSFDRVKLSRLKYLQVQSNKYFNLSQFLKWLVSMFSVMDSLILEYTDSIQWISCVKVASNLLFRLSDRNVDPMNTQVRLLNSLVRLGGRVNSELVVSMRNTERIIRELYAILMVQFNTQSRNTFLNVLPSVYFLNTYTLLRALHCLHKLLPARIAESFEITVFSLLWKSCHLACASKFNLRAVTCISG